MIGKKKALVCAHRKIVIHEANIVNRMYNSSVKQQMSSLTKQEIGRENTVTEMKTRLRWSNRKGNGELC
jgi:hypothetical protein